MPAHPTYPWRTILVPTDFSSCADAAVSLARRIAFEHNARLVLLHVGFAGAGLGLHTVVRPEGHAEGITVERYLQEGAMRELEGQAARLIAKSVPCTFKVAFGTPHEAIVESIEQTDADLVIMGTHGRTGLAHMLIGSVAERVVRTSPVPVLTVRAGGDDGSHLTPEELRMADEGEG